MPKERETLSASKGCTDKHDQEQICCVSCSSEVSWTSSWVFHQVATANEIEKRLLLRHCDRGEVGVPSSFGIEGHHWRGQEQDP